MPLEHESRCHRSRRPRGGESLPRPAQRLHSRHARQQRGRRPRDGALNPLTGLAQPFVNLFDNGTWLLNVSINNVPLTQLNGSTRRSAPVFLVAGLNVISAANAAVSTDYFVRDGGTGQCTLP